ncbi:hypothetical protein CYY_006545, partial [Polysphondylium violaceum]
MTEPIVEPGAVLISTGNDAVRVPSYSEIVESISAKTTTTSTTIHQFTEEDFKRAPTEKEYMEMLSEQHRQLIISRILPRKYSNSTFTPSTTSGELKPRLTTYNAKYVLQVSKLNYGEVAYGLPQSKSIFEELNLKRNEDYILFNAKCKIFTNNEKLVSAILQWHGTILYGHHRIIFKCEDSINETFDDIFLTLQKRHGWKFQSTYDDCTKILYLEEPSGFKDSSDDSSEDSSDDSSAESIANSPNSSINDSPCKENLPPTHINTPLPHPQTIPKTVISTTTITSSYNSNAPTSLAKELNHVNESQTSLLQFTYPTTPEINNTNKPPSASPAIISPLITKLKEATDGKKKKRNNDSADRNDISPITETHGASQPMIFKATKGQKDISKTNKHSPNTLSISSASHQKKDQQPVHITAVYAPATPAERKVWLQENLKVAELETDILIGDINIRKVSKRPEHFTENTLLSLDIQDSGLSELEVEETSPIKHTFTFTQTKEEYILDRVFISDPLLHKLPTLRYLNVNKQTSDHNILQLIIPTTTQTTQKSRLWKLNHKILTQQNIAEATAIIEHASQLMVNGSQPQKVFCTLKKLLKTFFMKKEKVLIDIRYSQLKTLRTTLSTTHEGDPAIPQLLQQIDEIQKHVDEDLFNKSSINKQIHSESPSKYLTNILNTKKKDSAIKEIIHPTSKQKVSTQPEIEDAFTTFYSQLFSKKADNAENHQTLLEKWTPNYPPSMNTILSAPISDQEIILAITKMKEGKAPGEDGISISLYKSCCLLLTPLLSKLFNSFLNEGIHN